MFGSRPIRRLGIVAAAATFALTSCTSSPSDGPPASPLLSPSSGETASSGGGSTKAPQAAETESNPAGDIPDTQAFVTYAPPAGGYTVQVPEGWARTESTTSVLFSDKYNSITIATASASTAPTEQAAQAELAALASGTAGFSPGSVSKVQRTAGVAVLITYMADSAVNEVTGKVVSQDVERYEFWNNGLAVTLTLSAPAGSDNVDPWRTVTDSLAWSA